MPQPASCLQTFTSVLVACEAIILYEVNNFFPLVLLNIVKLYLVMST